MGFGCLCVKFFAFGFNCYESWCLCSFGSMGFDMVLSIFGLSMWELELHSYLCLLVFNLEMLMVVDLLTSK